MRLLSVNRSRQRRGVILLVVLSMLTLFALLGISFVLVAQSQETASRIAREAEAAFRPEIDPEAAFSLFLSQLLYDVADDDTGVFSALRGQSLSRNMYGFDPSVGIDPVTMMPYRTLNDKPYNGTGRLHLTPSALAAMGGVASDDAFLMNYTYYPVDPSLPAGTPSFLRDPERPGSRANLGSAQRPYLGGFGVPYTYPDHNNFYLAEIDPSDGSVVVPSFHREYLFGPLDLPAVAPPTNGVPYPMPGANWNPNWTNAQGKYLTLRPTPGYHPNFPMPLDRNGDVKNLDFAPGGADSIWVDMGAPIMTAADGRKYKMLVAPLVLALDGRLDINTVGNIMGSLVSPNTAPSHRSNQGWGSWEVNPNKVLNADATEWMNLYGGSPKNAATNLSRIRGRYDQNTGTPAPYGAAVTPTNPTRAWAQVDYNGMVDTTGSQSSPYVLPTAASPSSYLGFPSFPPATFGNGGAAENPNHASIYSALRPRGTNRRFPIASAAQLLRLGGTGSDMLISDAARLLPNNLMPDPLRGPNDPANLLKLKRRNLITLLSADLDRPGATPYVWDPNDTSDATRFRLLPKPQSTPTPPENGYAPQSLPIQFPDLTPYVVPPAGSEFDLDYRSTLGALLRLDLNRPLTPYPPPDLSDPTGGTYGLMTDTVRVLAATRDRQAFANDIFTVLMKVTGALDAATAYNTYGKDSPEYRGVRYLAQLATNVVDQIDGDDISTPFNWAKFTADDGTVVNEFVFGVELPRLVVNETYVQCDNTIGSLVPVDPLLPMGDRKVDSTKQFNVNVWVELHNPMPDDSKLSGYADTTALLTTGAGANAAYRILLVDPDLNGTPTSPFRHPDNALGDPDFGSPPTRIRSAMTDWGGEPTNPKKITVTPGGGTFGDGTNTNVGFYVAGPKTTGLFLDATEDDPALPVTIGSAKLTYTVPADPKITTSIPRPTVVLQRLANPGLPYDNTPTSATYNPYLTVDFAETSAAQVMDGRRYDTNGPIAGGAPAGAMTKRSSAGRTQPYAGFLGQRRNQALTTPPKDQPKHTFFRQNCTRDTAAALNATPAGGDATLKIPFDWLTHLDRRPTNPLELLTVSDARPHDLTQRFVTDTAIGSPAHQHLAPWTDGTARLHRFFEFVTATIRGTPAAGFGRLPGPGGRVAGKVNVNGIWNPEVLRALADAQGGNSFVGPPANPDSIVDQVFMTLMTQRLGSTPPGTRPVIGPTDQALASFSGQPLQKPVWGFGVGSARATSDPLLRTAATRGVETTLFQPGGGTSMFDVPPGHPYQKQELLRKIYGSLTTRSNVFAVWATVGYFEVEDETVRPVKLGKEIGQAENRQLRHRMFSIVDRTQVQQWPTFVPGRPSTPTVTSTGAVFGSASGTVNQVVLSTNAFTRADSAPLAGGTPYTWALKAGAILVYEPNTDNEETVAVSPRQGGGFQAIFRSDHAIDVPVIVRGNPGPLLRYDPRQDTDVVPYFALID